MQAFGQLDRVQDVEREKLSLITDSPHWPSCSLYLALAVPSVLCDFFLHSPLPVSCLLQPLYHILVSLQGPLKSLLSVDCLQSH